MHKPAALYGCLKLFLQVRGSFLFFYFDLGILVLSLALIPGGEQSAL